MRHLAAVLSLLLAVALRAEAPADAPVAAPLAQEAFAALLTRDLVTHFNLEGDLQLEFLRPWTPPERVARDWQVQITEYPSVAASALLLRCRILADGQPLGETTLTLRAALWRDAWVARQPLTTNTPFDASQLETRRVDLLRERDALPAAVGDRSFNFVRGVQAGRLLTWRDIARRPLVKKGEMVEVSAADGMLVVTMKALAMQNGAQGEVVTVRNLDSKKDFSAFVIDENRVQVRF
ncbi:flagellar basal body P-ring formation chaperone FlgA [Oleiharenicola sp. Vm1]|uniref:flagellar basal body P-ring formation chaperone FlgA n=1 Tax=Oleiharenicola sp. Vm1 TaxID=3398393 RepID=UPI0039F5E43E